ncbi:hypothetical protein ILUMI_20760 [Ignelater luminosus]|uniref:Uncharacterized protein n=1 Tax=Ignelater luminosus TaxID=2038154 RepID=A0A8K0CK81_IGNLU|nr:hypothetical protein ILUMI_20760 [Ignelater luminosus]
MPFFGEVHITPHTFTSEAVEYGKMKEAVAVSLLEEVLGVSVKQSGLFIDVENSFLGALPDVNPKGNSSVIAVRGKRQLGVLVSAERGVNVTAEICMSATGAYMLPMLIFPRKQIQKEFKVGLSPGA